jgi:flavin-dependent thymidylate synthase
MRVHLAGYNVDTAVLSELLEKDKTRQDVTPEVISAAYARISRDPRSIEEIRKEARQEVEKARKSNSTIIFKMGHHSVAEHAVFNFDIVGVSRLAMEEVEKFRLASYTEKSQRYITLDKDYVLPQEIEEGGFKDLFIETVVRQNEAYHELLVQLKEYVFVKNKALAQDAKNHNLLEGWAKEDARYATSLAIESQVGLTINARNLELLLRRFASHPLAEIRQLGQAIYGQVADIAPSIVIFHQANDRDTKTYPELKKKVSGLLKNTKALHSLKAGEEVKLVEFTKEGDCVVAASLMHSASGLDFESSYKVTKKLSLKEKTELFKTAWRNMQFYDSMLREFEYVNLTFDIVLSAACFGQLKRHRMATITALPYNPDLGITVPESIKAIGQEKYLRQIVLASERAYGAIFKKMPLAAPYVLTNAHRKRVLIRVNAREMYHISRLREDAHAQWDIQNISRAMTAQAKKVMPLVFAFAGGKDTYNETYKRIFGTLPKVTEAILPSSRKIRQEA